MARILGIDYGKKRLGIAISDESGQIASALATIERRGLQTDLKNLKNYIDQYQVSKIIVGLPLHMDKEEESKEEAKVRDFVSKLEEVFGIPVEKYDERLSTQEADAILLSAELSPKKRKKYRDRVAASIILQRYLEDKNEK